jgi:hypothetical protein
VARVLAIAAVIAFFFLVAWYYARRAKEPSESWGDDIDKQIPPR